MLVAVTAADVVKGFVPTYVAMEASGAGVAVSVTLEPAGNVSPAGSV